MQKIHRVNLVRLNLLNGTYSRYGFIVGEFPSPGLTAGRTDRPFVRPCIVSGRVGEEQRLSSGEKNSNKSISNLMEALATRAEGWTCSILKEPCVWHRLDSSGADLLARSLSRWISPSGFRPRSPQENFFGGTFRSNSAVDLLIYDFSVHNMVLTIYTPNCATVRIHRMTNCLAINPSDDNTWCAINRFMSTPSSLLAFFFSHRTAFFRFNGTPWIFLTTLCA